jgi:hypothetical protein
LNGEFLPCVERLVYVHYAVIWRSPISNDWIAFDALA